MKNHQLQQHDDNDNTTAAVFSSSVNGEDRIPEDDLAEKLYGL
jgi:hypothetical protein